VATVAPDSNSIARPEPKGSSQVHSALAQEVRNARWFRSP
jgi:hypothetical protein